MSSKSIFKLAKSQSAKQTKDDKTVFKDIDGKRQYFAPGALVQPCTSIETLLTVAGSYKNQTTIQAIWLDSDSPIEEDAVRQALVILSKKLPVLQFCLSKQGLQVWFRRIKDFAIDFETSSKDVMEVFHEMLETNFDLWHGPLWKVKMATVSSRTKKKYGAALVFCVQHTITDGTTNMRICRETVSILNQMMKGEEIDTSISSISQNIDDFYDCTPTLGFLTKTFLKKFNMTMLKGFQRKASFDGNLKMPKTKKPKTKVLFDDFTEAETKNLIQMCKHAKITVHSFIVTLTNFALMTLVQSKTPDCPIGAKTITATHCVNLRRYFHESQEDALGCHISWLENKNKMSLNEVKDFWGAAKRVHYSIKEEIEVKKSHLMMLPILQYAGLIFPTNKFLTSNGFTNKTDCHYVTTNMGNLKHLLPGPKSDDIVETSYIVRGVSSHLSNNPFLLTFHTFRSRFMISVDYYTCKMTDDAAQEFFSILCAFIRKMTSYDQLDPDLKKSDETLLT